MARDSYKGTGSRHSPLARRFDDFKKHTQERGKAYTGAYNGAFAAGSDELDISPHGLWRLYPPHILFTMTEDGVSLGFMG
jgi:hypothetical protein